MFIPTPLTLCSWICTAKGWVVLCSGCLAAGYFAVAYVLREIVFPILKNAFENIIVYQFFHEILSGWIEDVKLLFYGALLYFAIGMAGLIGALCAIGLLLWPYAAYLVVGAVIGAKKVWDVFSTIVDAEDDLRDACNKVGSIFGGDCDGLFDKIRNYTYGAGGALMLLQFTTFICTLVLLRRIHKDTHRWVFTCCGHKCGGLGGRKKKNKEDELEKGIPLGRMRRRRTERRRGTAEEALLAAAAAEEEEKMGGGELSRRSRREKAGDQEEEDVPSAVFSLPRRRDRATPAEEDDALSSSSSLPPAYDPHHSQVRAEQSFEMGKPGRRESRWSDQRGSSSVLFDAERVEGSSGGERRRMRSIGKEKRLGQAGEENRSAGDFSGGTGSTSDGARSRTSRREHTSSRRGSSSSEAGWNE